MTWDGSQSWFLRFSDDSSMGAGVHITALKQWFSNLSTHQNHLEEFVISLLAASHCLTQVRAWFASVNSLWLLILLPVVLKCRAMLLGLSWAYESPGDPVKMQILVVARGKYGDVVLMV